MITSTWRSTPSAVTILSGPTSATASVTTSTSGREQRRVPRRRRPGTRLQPIGCCGVRRSRSSGSGTSFSRFLACCASKRRFVRLPRVTAQRERPRRSSNWRRRTKPQERRDAAEEAAARASSTRGRSSGPPTAPSAGRRRAARPRRRSRARAGSALAPVPTTATRLPARSTSSVPAAGVKARPVERFEARQRRGRRPRQLAGRADEDVGLDCTSPSSVVTRHTASPSSKSARATPVPSRMCRPSPYLVDEASPRRRGSRRAASRGATSPGWAPTTASRGATGCRRSAPGRCCRATRRRSRRRARGSRTTRSPPCAARSRARCRRSPRPTITIRGVGGASVGRSRSSHASRSLRSRARRSAPRE